MTINSAANSALISKIEALMQKLLESGWPDGLAIDTGHGLIIPKLKNVAASHKAW